jgi:hypothetical protein
MISRLANVSFLECTVEDPGSNGMDTKLQMAGFWWVLKYFGSSFKFIKSWRQGKRREDTGK